MGLPHQQSVTQPIARAEAGTRACTPEAATCFRNSGGEGEQFVSWSSSGQSTTCLRNSRGEGEPFVSLSSSEQSMTETAEERESRLSWERARRVARSSPTSETRLVQMTSVERRRRATESPDQREARVQHMRACQQERIASETPEEIAARRQDLTTRQQERITSETPEETEARRQRDREAHSYRAPPVSAQPLLHQPAVKARMKRFHSQLASLEVSTCTTCLERFPGMTTRHTAAGTVCIRCHRYTHSPKAYSRENNMQPGPVPMELVVSVGC